MGIRNPAPGCATAGAERPVPEGGRVHRAIQREQESGLETRRHTVSHHPPKFSSGAAASNQVKVHHMYTDPYVKASGKSADAKELRRLQKRLAAVKKAHNTVHAPRKGNPGASERVSATHARRWWCVDRPHPLLSVRITVSCPTQYSYHNIRTQRSGVLFRTRVCL